MSNSVKRKSQQLGISFSTANNRLYKKILFWLVQKNNMDKCFQCKKKIINEDELSIEHKIPWLYNENPKELFFDINNIAFSHLKCNSENSRRNIRIRTKSGYKGIYYEQNRKGTKKWYAYTTVNGKIKFIGRFATLEQASEAHDNFLEIHISRKLLLTRNLKD